MYYSAVTISTVYRQTILYIKKTNRTNIVSTREFSYESVGIFPLIATSTSLIRDLKLTYLTQIKRCESVHEQKFRLKSRSLK